MVGARGADENKALATRASRSHVAAVSLNPQLMSEGSGRAVFLSYAREDTATACRIADTLRASGIEIWLDQSELQSGETWDATIRQRIKGCALFMAVISANTQARREGYFRREWHLAVERTLDMAHGTPFLVPVVIDDTAEAKALVPEQFMRVQWTRLPQGVPDARFVEQIKRLLALPASVPPIPLVSPAPATPSRRPGLPWWGWTALALAVATGILALWPARRSSAASPSDRSIAVLPFTSLSDDRETAHFADGIHEDILTNLTLVRGLRVISRTSAMQYRDTRPSMRQISEALNVAYIVEGSVRGRGSKLRVTVQLIDARTDEHVWAKSFDPDVSDIFATQTELATTIATQLKANIAAP